jgi:hypothetical protein
VARNLSVTKGIAVTKALELEGRPTVHVQHHASAQEDLRVLREKAIPDHPAITAEVIEEEPELPAA